MGNRDEFYKRPTAAMHWWKSGKSTPIGSKDLLAGKDLEAGGTWMGLTASGKFAAITNFRDLDNVKENAPSRGDLVNDFLQGDVSASDFMKQLNETGEKYNGFNLLFGTVKKLHYFSNYGKQKMDLQDGVHGISNGFLNEPWPKVELAKKRLKDALESGRLTHEQLEEFMADRTEFSKNLPNTGVSEEFEKKLSATCIVTPDYGTRVTTVMMLNRKGEMSVSEVNRLTEERVSYRFAL